MSLYTVHELQEMGQDRFVFPEGNKVRFGMDFNRGMSVPKCTSWLGHRFQPRFDKSGSQESDAEYHGPAAGLLALAEASRKVTYVHDICVRCGHVVPRQPHNGEQGS